MEANGQVPVRGGYSIHAVIGFDERPILHCLKEALGRGRVDKLVLYQAATGDPTGERRSQEALDTLKSLLAPLGVNVEVHKLPPRNLPGNIVAMYELVDRDLSAPGGMRILACLASGMRPLVLALYTAILAQPEERHDLIELCVEPEGRPEERIVQRLSDITRLTTVLSSGDHLQVAILRVLGSLGGATLSELNRRLAEEGVQVNRSKLYRVLTRLVEKGVLEKDETSSVYRLKVSLKQ
ncbi:hypothetical protein Pyrfu_0428 [Pyrolobus fumarii 1A]|uniref:CRISPR locus-related DNA-binding protein n=1 Tax=Pyrolobus fumarii (strain DSM 11204 / 1A) TaxID=694429 RepID=G0EG51_PYRF1|nr:hypothetical protein [Pyrolobus fumarii]AEM38299.1 hypothetical protein Pyrfu_0428 [Pyrolobus fumarii 1A]